MTNHLVGKERMAQTPYIYKKFPAYRYKKDCNPVVVHTQAEDDKRLSDGWRKTPKEQVFDGLPDSFKGGNDEEQAAIKKSVSTVIEKGTGISNMLLRVPKSRRKKDLYVVGDMLGLDLDSTGYSLKKLKSVILDEAKKTGYLQDHLNAQEQENEHSTTSH
jgi:hypothetical protein